MSHLVIFQQHVGRRRSADQEEREIAVRSNDVRHESSTYSISRHLRNRGGYLLEECPRRGASLRSQSVIRGEAIFS